MCPLRNSFGILKQIQWIYTKGVRIEKHFHKHIYRFYHETINEQEQHLRIFLYKSPLNSACLWSKARLAINKKEKYCFCYQTTNFLNNRFLSLLHTKEQKFYTSQLVTKSMGIKGYLRYKTLTSQKVSFEA